MASTQGTDEGDGLQIWGMAVNMFNKQPQTINGEWSFNLEIWCEG